MHSPRFRFPLLFYKKFQIPWKTFPISSFPTNFFLRQNFWCPFLVESPCYFRCFGTFLPISGKFLFPYFFKFPPSFVKFTCFLHDFMWFSFSPSLANDHDLCITHCTYWTPLSSTSPLLIGIVICRRRFTLNIYAVCQLSTRAGRFYVCAWACHRWLFQHTVFVLLDDIIHL